MTTQLVPTSPLDLPPVRSRSPQALIRLGALPADALDAVVDTALATSLAGLAGAERALREGMAAASDELFAGIGAEEDAGSRRLLLAARRDLHNARAPKAAATHLIEARRGFDATRQVLAALRSRDAHLAAVLEAYPEALRRAWAHILALTSEPSVHEGIRVSSRALSQGLAQLRRSARPGRAFGSRDQQVLRGALRYVSRAARKATPFATFCLVADVRFTEDDAGDGAPWGIGEPAGVARVARLNKQIFAILWGRLKDDPETRRELTVEVNPTVVRTEARLSFLASVSGKELFQQVGRAAELDFVLDRLEAAGRATIVTLAQALSGSAEVDATPAEAEEYLDALLKAGLLRFVAPVPQFEAEWFHGLGDVAKRLPGTLAQAIGALCDDAARVVALLSASDDDVRARGFELLDRALAEIATAASLTVKWPPALVYEDCGAPFTVLVAANEMEPALSAFGRLTARLMHDTGRHIELARMRDAFDELHPADDAAVPLIEFFEAMERRLDARKTAAAAKALEEKSPPPPVPAMDAGTSAPGPETHEATVQKRQVEYRERWLDCIRRAWSSDPLGAELSVSSEAVLGPDRRLDGNALAPSWSTFCQLIPATSEHPARIFSPSLQVLPGLGKFFSRFLHVLPTSRTERLRAANDEAESAVFAEIAGDSNFNGNLHPPLLGKLLAYPAGDGDGSAHQVRCSDLMVTRSRVEAHALELRDADSGRLVVPVDLGFLNPMMRPALYRFLLKFAPGGPSGVPLPSRLDSDAPVTDAITHRPRIVIDGRFVIARRAWRVPHELFPAPIAGETPPQTFARVSSWRLEQGLPDRAYLRIIVRTSPGTGGPPVAERTSGSEAELETTVDTVDDDGVAPGSDASSEATADDEPPPAPGGPSPAAAAPNRVDRPSRDLLKPQFLDLRSPIFVDLLVRLVTNTRAHDLLFEEEYPAPDLSPRVSGRAHVAECLLQFSARDVAPVESTGE